MSTSRTVLSSGLSAGLSRRDFGRWTAAGLAGLAVGGPALASALARGRGRVTTFFSWEEIREGVHVTTESSTGGNAMVMQTDGGSVLVDAKNAQFGTTLRREAGALGKPVKLLINTHHHADHTGGNHAFLDPAGDDTGGSSVRVLMHPSAKPRVEAQVERYQGALRGAARSVPDEVGDATARDEILALAERADEMTAASFAPLSVLPEGFFRGQGVDFGGKRLKVRHIGAGHTDNDIFIYDDDTNVLHTGDLVFHKLHPFFDESAKATSLGWMESCQAMVDLCNDDTVVIPGHGEITDVEGIKGQIKYFETVREAAGSALDAGKSKEDFAGSDIEALAGYGFERIKARTFGSVYDEIVRERG